MADANQPGEPSDDYEVQPPHSEHAEDVLRRLQQADTETPPDEPTPERPELRFTLAQLMVVITCASLLLAALRLMPLPIAAGAMGLVALFGMILLDRLNAPPLAARLLWFVLLGLYGMLSILAARGPR